MAYNPRTCGAKCDVCPLNKDGEGPVPPTLVPGATTAMVGQAPGLQEVKEGRYFCGPSGRLIDQTLRNAGLKRSTMQVQNVLACRPPKDDIKAYLAKLDHGNKKRIRAGEEPIPSPIDCCLPRLYHELGTIPDVIVMGAVAAKAVIPGHRGGILKVRGTLVGPVPHLPAEAWDSDDFDPRWVPDRKILPVLHPAAVLRSRRWTKVLQADIDRAARWFSGELRWQEPGMEFMPSPARLRELLQHPMQWRGMNVFAYDFETDGLRATEVNVRCVAIATTEWAVVVPFLSIDGFTKFYTSADEREIIDIIVAWAEDETVLKVGHNAGNYDRLVFESWTQRELGRRVTPKPLLDTILIHRSIDPELPHDLGFVASFFQDVPDWKGDHSATDAKSDNELWVYNARDGVINARILEPLYGKLLERSGEVEVHFHPNLNQVALLQLDHEVQAACVGMHRNGMLIDQVRRAEHEERLTGVMLKWAYRARTVLQEATVDIEYIIKKVRKEEELAADWEILDGLSKSEKDEGWVMAQPAQLGQYANFNPGSHPQLRYVLFEEWDMPIPTDMDDKELYTKTGEFSTGDAVLRRLLMDRRIPDTQKKFIQAVRLYRRSSKLLGTFVRPMRLPTGNEKADKGCVLYDDGRVHSVWNSHTPATGRVASTTPNAQNWPIKIRDMVVAAPGNVFVGADMDQLELRIAADCWNAEPYLEAFENDIDAHQVTMMAIYGPERFWSFKDGPSAFGKKDFDKKGEFGQMRHLAKTTQYLSQYGGGLEAFYRVLTAAEDKKTGQLLFSHLSMREAGAIQEKWLEGCAAFPQGWDREMSTFAQIGYLVELVTGRRRDFLDGGKLQEVVNWRVQPTAAAIMNLILRDLLVEIPFEKWGPNTGLFHQGHDSLTVECPKAEAEWTKGVMHKCMNRMVSGFRVPFTAEVDIAWPRPRKLDNGTEVPDLHSRWINT